MVVVLSGILADPGALPADIGRLVLPLCPMPMGLRADVGLCRCWFDALALCRLTPLRAQPGVNMAHSGRFPAARCPSARPNRVPGVLTGGKPNHYPATGRHQANTIRCPLQDHYRRFCDISP